MTLRARTPGPKRYRSGPVNLRDRGLSGPSGLRCFRQDALVGDVKAELVATTWTRTSCTDPFAVPVNNHLACEPRGPASAGHRGATASDVTPRRHGLAPGIGRITYINTQRRVPGHVGRQQALASSPNIVAA